MYIYIDFSLNQDNNDTEQDRAANRLTGQQANTYDLKSKLSAPPVAELRAFEVDDVRMRKHHYLDVTFV